MSCKEWKNDWVAQLYGELDPPEERALLAHLDGCEKCRARMEALSESRDWLREACPETPHAPPVVVLRPARRFVQPLWAFASGVACAVLLFGAGLLAGYGLPGRDVDDGTSALTDSRLSGPMPATEIRAVPDESSRREIDSILSRLSVLETRAEPPAQEPAAGAVLTQAELDEALRRFERKTDVKRARDLAFVIDELTASEARTGSYLDETRQAIAYVALQSDPRVTQR